MKITKNVKDYVVKQVNKVYDEKVRTISAELNEKRHNLENTILEYLNTEVKPHIADLMTAAGADEEITRYGSTYKAVDCLLDMHPCYLSFSSLAEETDNKLCKLRGIKEEMLEEFFLMCDIGALNFEEFKAAVAELNFDNVEL